MHCYGSPSISSLIWSYVSKNQLVLDQWHISRCWNVLKFTYYRTAFGRRNTSTRGICKSYSDVPSHSRSICCVITTRRSANSIQLRLHAWGIWHLSSGKIPLRLVDRGIWHFFKTPSIDVSTHVGDSARHPYSDETYNGNRRHDVANV